MRYEGYRLGIVLVSTAKKDFKEARAEDDVVFLGFIMGDKT